MTVVPDVSYVVTCIAVFSDSLATNCSGFAKPAKMVHHRLQALMHMKQMLLFQASLFFIESAVCAMTSLELCKNQKFR